MYSLAPCHRDILFSFHLHHCAIFYPVGIKHPFNGPLSGTTRVSRHQKGKTNLDFTEARDSEWQWHQLGHMQVCTLQAGCTSCRPTSITNQYDLYVKCKQIVRDFFLILSLTLECSWFFEVICTVVKEMLIQ